MDEHVDALLETPRHCQGRVQDGVDVPQPAARLHAVEERCHGRCLQFARLEQLRQTAPHHVNVLDPAELELDVLVKVFVLVPLAGRPVRHGVDLTRNSKPKECLRCRTKWFMNRSLTLGRVSTTYMNFALGFDWTMLFNSCSSSTHRALNPDKGWLHRHSAACINHTPSISAL